MENRRILTEKEIVEWERLLPIVEGPDPICVSKEDMAAILNTIRYFQVERKLLCCQLDCDQPAEWVIVHGLAPDDYTHACTAHVGDLLTDAKEQHVYHVKPA